MTIKFKDYQQSLAPGWLRQLRGGLWLAAIGQAKDALEYGVRSAIYERFPDYASWDALPRLGGERQFDRGVTETESQFRTRIKGAWDLWPKAGTPDGILTALNYAGYLHVYLISSNGETWTRDAGTGVVTLTRQSAGYTFSKGWWNEFHVIFETALPASWVPTPPANGSNEVNNIRRILNLWKPAKALLNGMTVIQTGNVWGWPVGRLWGDPGITWGGTAVQYTAT